MGLYIKSGENRKEVFKSYTKLKEKFEKDKKEKYDKIKKGFTKQLPSFSGKMKYKSGNPLKKLLGGGKRATIKVGGY